VPRYINPYVHESNYHSLPLIRQPMAVESVSSPNSGTRLDSLCGGKAILANGAAGHQMRAESVAELLMSLFRTPTIDSGGGFTVKE